MIKTLICVPTYENVDPNTFKSIYDLVVPEGCCRPDFEFVLGYGCAQARNKCATMAMERGYDYLMFVDSDVTLPLLTLCEMLQYPKDIVVGIYPRRNTYPTTTEVFLNTSYDFLDENNLALSEVPTFLDTPEIDVPEDKCRLDVKGGGLGCALINVNLFTRMQYPYFRYVEYESGATLAEDNYFCWKASELGATIQCDYRIRCSHKFSAWEC